MPTAGIGRFDELYLRYKVWIPTNWKESTNVGNKLLGLIGKADDGTPFDLAVGGNRPGDSWSFRPIIGDYARLGGYIYAIDPNLNDPFGSAFNVKDLEAGWNTIMVHVRLNTPGVSDGTARLFVGEQLVYVNDLVQWRDADMADIDITLMLVMFQTNVAGAMELHYADIELLVPTVA